MSHKTIDAIAIGIEGPTKVVHQAERCGKAKCHKFSGTIIIRRADRK